MELSHTGREINMSNTENQNQESIVAKHFNLEPTPPQGVWVDQNMDDSEEAILDTDYMIGYFDKYFNWGKARGIIAANGGTAKAQIAKLHEEVDEILEGINENDRKKIVDGIGDSLVVLTQLVRLTGISFDEAMAEAWNSIKDRTGLMRCGVFVKQADLDLIGDFDWVAFEKCTDSGMVRDLIAKAKEWDKNGRVATDKYKG